MSARPSGSDKPANSAERNAWYIGQLVNFLEDHLHYLTPELYEKLKAKLDQVPPDEWKALDPAEFPPLVHLSVEEFLDLAPASWWTTAQAIVEERKRSRMGTV